MVQLNKIFKCAQGGGIVIVIPQGDALQYRYKDIHLESNAVIRRLDEPDVSHLVVDFGVAPLLGSIIVGSILKFARRVTDRDGKVAFCNASPEMLEVLQTMNLHKLWPYYATRAEAIEAVQA